MKIALELTPEILEAIAERAAELVLERLGDVERNDSPYMSPDEAALFLGCGRQRIYDLRSSGRLTPYRDGGRAVVLRADVEKLVEVEGLERRRRAA